MAKKKRKYSLNRSYYGLYVPALIWRSLDNFSTNALALIVTDKEYNENEYIRDFNEFSEIKLKGENKQDK